MVFTRIRGVPISPTIRHLEVDAVGELGKPGLVAVDGDGRIAGGMQGNRGGLTQSAACTCDDGKRCVHVFRPFEEVG
jgi:hypothetical protein